jgi:hypothetical protein
MTVTVLASFESADRMLCVDVFRRSDGSFAFEEFRSELDGSTRARSGAGSLDTNDIVWTSMPRSRHGSPAIASAVLAAMLIPPAAHAAEGDAARYTLKREQRFFGFNSDGDGNAAGALPFDKSYEQLSAQQQARIKFSYEAMSDGDEPPFPVGGLRTLYVPITRAFQRLLVRGDFFAEVEIGADGNPVAMAVFKSPDPEITKVVSGIVLLSRFKPARCKGVPCAMAFPVHIAFKVE